MPPTAAPVAFIGYGLAWGDVAQRAGFSEEFAPGAFLRSLARRPLVRCVFGGQQLGTLQDGSLSIIENAAGLRLELQPWQDSPALAALRSKAGAIAGLTLHMRVVDATWAPPGARRHRTVLEAALVDVALVMSSPRRAPAFRSSWLAVKTPASTWRADLADLDARGRELDEDLGDLEAEAAR